MDIEESAQSPYFFTIVPNRSVTRKATAGRRVVNTHTGPSLRVLIGRGHSLLSIDVATKICRGHPGIVATANGGDHGIKDTGLKQIEMSAFQ